MEFVDRIHSSCLLTGHFVDIDLKTKHLLKRNDLFPCHFVLSMYVDISE
jgi:hypothetical protein